MSVDLKVPHLKSRLSRKKENLLKVPLIAMDRLSGGLVRGLKFFEVFTFSASDGSIGLAGMILIAHSDIVNSSEWSSKNSSFFYYWLCEG